MAIYAIGDIQGCYTELQQLLNHIDFTPGQDKLWLVGDLVNRGPDSLSVLRLLKSLGTDVVSVLGNHDLHLLAVAYGVANSSRQDTLQEILNAPDKTELLDWLRTQRMFYQQDDYALVHAGLLPQWTVAQAAALANEIEQILSGSEAQLTEFFQHMYGNKPNHWEPQLQGHPRHRLIVNALTRMRICNANGHMEYKFKGEYQDIPAQYYAWFDLPQRASKETTIIFGHWSALGLIIRPRLLALDTGCLWGGKLTAIRLQDRAVFQVDCLSQPQ